MNITDIKDIKMENIEKIESELWWRIQNLNCAVISLRNYQLTKTKRFYELAKLFGEYSQQGQQRLDRLLRQKTEGSKNEERLLPENKTDIEKEIETVFPNW